MFEGKSRSRKQGEAEEFNNEFRVISRNLVDGKLSEAGALLSKYKKSSDHAELVSFFAEKPPLVQYDLAQVYRKGSRESDLEAALTWYRQAGEAGHAKAQTMLGFLYRNGIEWKPILKTGGALVSAGS